MDSGNAIKLRNFPACWSPNRKILVSPGPNSGNPYKPMEVLKLNRLSKAKVSFHFAGLLPLTSGVSAIINEDLVGFQNLRGR